MLKSYAFDVDSNLVFTDTKIILEKKWENNIRIPVDVSQEEYEIVKFDTVNYRHVNNDIENSMANFKISWNFEQDILHAITQKKFWPSWNKFIEAHRYASPIGIITARWHSVEELKNTHKKIIMEFLTEGQREDLLYSMKERLGQYKISDEELIEDYLNNNYYAPCSNKEYLASIGKKLSDSMSDRKNAAFEQFVLHTKKVFETSYGKDFLAKRKIRVGFSDDTSKNIDWLHDHIYTKDIGLMRKYPEILFRMYDTGEVTAKPNKYTYKNTKEEE
jgi:hypothetical protein